MLFGKVILLERSALILEGGAMRGIYSAGAMDILAENNIMFPYVIGISAGAINALSYISGQAGRNAKVTLKYINDPRYLSLRNFSKTHSIFHFDFIFGELSSKLEPFDYSAFEASNTRFVAVATNCITGEAEYFEKGDCENIFNACIASGSMPLFTKPVIINKKPYLDGGISAPSGLPEALKQGYTKPVLILTRDKSYRKKPTSDATKLIYLRAFQKYPYLLKKLFTIPERYNAYLDKINAMEAQGKIFVIRPQKAVKVARLERNLQKLEDLYWDGRMETEALMPKLKKFLEI